MKKQLLTLFAILLAIAPAMSQSYDFSVAAPTGQTLYYKINGSNATVTYPSPTDENEAWYGYTKPTGALTIPSSVSYNGTTYTVTAIGSYAIYDCDGLTSVSIPSSVSSIGNYAFYGCSYLTTVNIPDGITTINDYCFDYCSRLTSITIPSSVTSIKIRAFSNCTGLASISIPNGVTSIGSNAFHNVRNIDYSGSATGNPWGAISVNGTKVVNYDFADDAPSGQALYYTINGTNATVTYPGPSSDQTWTGFTKPTGTLTIPSSVSYNGITYDVTAIGSYAIYDCDGLTSVSIPSSITSIGNYAFYGCSYLTTINIPDGITTINDYCFDYCSRLTSITIPSSVTSIKVRAFSNCTGLASISIPNGVTSIGSNAFYNVQNIDYNGSATGSPWGALYLNGVQIINYDFAEVAPSGQTLYYKINGTNATVSYPGPSSDQTWTGFTQPTGTLTIPNSVTYNGATYAVTAIGSYAIYDCDGLTSVSIPSSVSSIGNYAFYGCSYLTTVNIPDGITTINDYCFDYCSRLTSITIPSSVTSIKVRAFSNCTGLQEMIVSPTNPPSTGSNAFYHISTSTPIYVPCGRSSAYSASSAWSRFSNFPERPDYAVTALSSDNTMGTATVQSQPTCQSDIAVISATPNPSHRFVSWNDNITDNPRQVVVTRDTTFTATFEFVDTTTATYEIRTCTGQTLLFRVENATHTATVIGYVGQCNGGLTVPAWFSIDGVRYTVTAIGPRAFENCRTLESVILPRSITLVDTEAFKNCSALINVDMK